MSVAGSYTLLGIEHIGFGIDHLLFVLALLIITNGTVQLLKTVTAFTIAHSITLALATLGFVHVPSKPVEATIALSIVFVASEIIHRREGRDGIASRAPWIVAFTFGLLHGFGFAGALSEVGLPQNHIPAALFFFNIGVELGQIAFIAVVLTFIALVRRIPLRPAALGRADSAVRDWLYRDVLGSPAGGGVLRIADKEDQPPLSFSPASSTS